jgi:hypothetical protein
MKRIAKSAAAANAIPKMPAKLCRKVKRDHRIRAAV